MSGKFDAFSMHPLDTAHRTTFIVQLYFFRIIGGTVFFNRLFIKNIARPKRSSC